MEAKLASFFAVGALLIGGCRTEIPSGTFLSEEITAEWPPKGCVTTEPITVNLSDLESWSTRNIPGTFYKVETPACTGWTLR